jgi:hypothetical protein
MTREWRHRVCLHEAGHAVVGHVLGHRVRLVVAAKGARMSGFCEHYQRTDLSPLEAAVDDLTIIAAGEVGELLVPVTGYLEPVDDDDPSRVETALATIIPDDAGFVRHVLNDDRESGGDAARLEEIARDFAASAAGMEAALLKAWTRERAARLVWSNALAIAALAAELMVRPVLDGPAAEAIMSG